MHGISWVGSSESGTSRIVVMLGTEVQPVQCMGTTMGTTHVPCTSYSKTISLSLYYMYTRDNGVPIGLFRQFRLDL